MRRLCSHPHILSLSLAWSVLWTPSPLPAQAESDPDSKAYNSYSLTMPKYQKYLAVMIEIAKAAERRPAVADALEGVGDFSVQEAVARFEKVPEIRRAISGAGLTTREFVILQGSLLGTALAHGMMKQTGMSPDSASSLLEVSQANLEFYGKNEAEIGRLMKEAEAKAPGLKRGEETAEAEEEPAAADD